MAQTLTLLQKSHSQSSWLIKKKKKKSKKELKANVYSVKIPVQLQQWLKKIEFKSLNLS